MKQILIILLPLSVLVAQPVDKSLALSGGLQILDYATTQIIMQQGGVELNPVMSPFAGCPITFATVKVIVFYGCSRLEKRERRWANWFYFAVVVNNIYQIIK